MIPPADWDAASSVQELNEPKFARELKFCEYGDKLLKTIAASSCLDADQTTSRVTRKGDRRAKKRSTETSVKKTGSTTSPTKLAKDSKKTRPGDSEFEAIAKSRPDIWSF
jgi:hypothetical protein